VADAKQFGNPKVLQFGDKTAGDQSGDSGHCAQCEAMLADALDGTLSAADQALFDAHMAECGPCAQLLADARRGAAWLEMLRTPAPEPPAALLERILSLTSGAQAAATQASIGMIPIPAGTTLAPQPAMAPGYVTPGMAAAKGAVIPFHRRAAAAVRANYFGQIVLQPRLAMTAAMAFFSLALTMNLTGVHPLELRASDLTPSSLNRDFYSAKARVSRYYENLRVVYELESRVRDLQTATDNEPAAGSQGAAPTPSSNPQASPDQPAGAAPAAQPGQSSPTNGSPATQPGQKQSPPASDQKPKPAPPNSGTSRREGPARPRNGLDQLLADSDNPNSNHNKMNSNGNSENVEGSLV
jgi:hypothetical protein